MDGATSGNVRVQTVCRGRNDGWLSDRVEMRVGPSENTDAADVGKEGEIQTKMDLQSRQKRRFSC